MSSERFPTPNPGPSRARLTVRLGCVAGCSLLALVLFHELVVSTLPLLWPPTDPLSRWFGLVTVLVGSFVVGPGVVGTLVGDAVYDRFRGSKSTETN